MQDSYSEVSARFADLDLPRLLDDHGGIISIQDFLPGYVAEAVLGLLQQVPGGRWNATEAHKDYAQNNIAHAFLSTKSGDGLASVFRCVSLLLPGQLHSFSAARYDQQHHIAPHDDRAYTEVRMDDGAVVTCSRDIAVIYYLTKDWQAKWGGLLVDLEGGTMYVPRFNSLVAFRVPRYHQVTPLTTDRPRYSIFGWFLVEGIKYDLFQGDDAADEATRNAPGAGSMPAGRHRLTSSAAHHGGTNAVTKTRESLHARYDAPKRTAPVRRAGHHPIVPGKAPSKKSRRLS